MDPIRFETHPARYRHWKLETERGRARLVMKVDENGGLRPGYALKLNSYDLAVDIELADAVARLRFEHPGVSVVTLSSAIDGMFCAGANIFMLAHAEHGFKVNFCKFTNETRLAIEDASAHSGQRYLAALNGTCSGGGYELALACDEIILVDDRRSAVSLPEIAYLGVLPGTGGLTRLVDKRKVRRDLADLFATLAEGVRGERAVEWGLVDAVAPRSRFDETVAARAAALVDPARAGRAGIVLDALAPAEGQSEIRYRHLTLRLDHPRRLAELIVEGPQSVPPIPAEAAALGADFYPLRLFREIDDALLRLRFNYPEIGLVLIKSAGGLERVLDLDRALWERRADWFVNETVLLLKRVLKRLDLTAKSFFAIVEPGSCFGGSLLELALAADRVYMKAGADARVATSPLNGGALPMGNGLSRLQTRFIADPARAAALAAGRTFDADEAMAAGLVTAAPDDLDWEEELRLAIGERLSLSPD
ncbi:MAG TPA: enoyl-CoA hydratase-related protein, partial [Candidatus Binataceae bacterium]|nr:enoyl-CoA hydratase-related protein [Candidatus Binataceae bacterium]